MDIATLTALRAKVVLDAAANTLLQAGDPTGLRAYLNALSSPAYIVWRTLVSQDEIMLNGFDWARVDNLSVGKARVWTWLFDNAEKSLNPSKTNVRAGIDQTWVGTQADLDVRAAVYVHCKRTATAAEKLLSSGTGTTAVPATMTLEGELSDSDAARVVFRDDGTIWTP